MKENLVESFSLDHTKVKAPFVRLASKHKGPKGDIVSKFDLRFVQPNENAISTGAMHTLEHLLAIYFREKLDNVIDLSPMGCRTGFYFLTFGEMEPSFLVTVLQDVLKKVIGTDEVPAANAVQCGNYLDHSLIDAVECAKKIVDNLRVFEV